MDIANIARSGMQFGQTVVTASASNIANSRTTGAIAPVSAVQAVYEPVRAESQSQQNGGVASRFALRGEAPVIQYDPGSPLANGEGLVAAPAVDLTEELVELRRGQQIYTANAAVLRTDDRMMQTALDLLA